MFKNYTIFKLHYRQIYFTVYTLANAFDLVHEDLPSIARQGSGSACRSIYGGFVHWKAGVDDLGSDSTAVQIAPDTHWPEMRILILVVENYIYNVYLLIVIYYSVCYNILHTFI